MNFKAIVLGLSLVVGLSVVSTNAYAFGKASSSSSSSSSAPSSGSSASGTLSSIETIALNVAIIYAESDPRYAPILAALNIHSAADVQKLLSGDTSGTNFNSIISYFVMLEGQKNPQVSQILNDLGIHNFSDIQAFLSNPSSLLNQNTLFNIAYDYASQNSQYSTWLNALGIHSGADLAQLLKGGINQNNLETQLISIGIAYLISKTNAKNSANSLYPALMLGAFQGLPISDVTQITNLAAGKVN